MTDTFFTASQQTLPSPPPPPPPEMRMTRSMTNKYNKDNKENNHNYQIDTTFNNNDNGKRTCEEKEAATPKRLRSQQLNDSATTTPTTTTFPIDNNTSNEHSTLSYQSSQHSASQLIDQEQQDDRDDDNEDFDNNLTSQKVFSQDSSRLNNDGHFTPMTDSQRKRYFSHSPSPANSPDGWEGIRPSPNYSPPPIELPTRSDGLRYSDLEDEEDEENDPDTHYSTFGWPDMDQSSRRESFLDNDDYNNEDRLSHLPSSDPYFSLNDNTTTNNTNNNNNNNHHNHSSTFLSERPLQRTLIQDFLQVEDYVPSDTYDQSGLDSDGQRTGGPTDEMDLFFSANQADYPSMSFSTKLSISQQKQEFLALAKPTYITNWPHFLTCDYFDKHDAHDRSDIVPSLPSSPRMDPLDDNDNDVDEKDRPSQHQDTNVTAAETISSISTASYFDTKFSVLQRIGSGEYADVWKVWNTESNEVFAVKKLKIPFQSFSDRWLQLVEARNMMMVQDSPYCLNLFNAWEQDGYLYLQTDLAVATLDDYIQHQQEPIEESMAWKIIYEMAMGLQAIHHAGLVHLDLKPSNIMIDSNGTLKIGDFGTSIRRPMDVYEFKGEGDRHYMAPDLLREEYDSPADVFSLGLVIFEMMTRVQLPPTGDSWEMLRLGDFSNYKQVLKDVPLEIRRLLLLMLNSSSDRRATMDDILALPHLQRLAALEQQNTGALYSFAQLIQDAQE